MNYLEASHVDDRRALAISRAHDKAAAQRSSHGLAGTHWVVQPSGGTSAVSSLSQQRQERGHSPENHKAQSLSDNVQQDLPDKVANYS